MRAIDIRARLRVIDDEINALYWAFTRQRRAKPPVVARPDLYAERRQLEDELGRRAAKRRAKSR